MSALGSTHARRLTHHPHRLLLAAMLLTWFSATALLAAHRGAERRMDFDGAAHR
jgi:hypothetical protein